VAKHELAIINLNVDIIRNSLFSTFLMVNRLILIVMFSYIKTRQEFYQH